MQLSARQALRHACCSLLGTAPLVAQASEPWQMDIGLMNYLEADRNTGVELLVNGERSLDDGAAFAISGVLDVITGATPNGASASNVPQTFTMASGSGSYTSAANELPVDDTHMDTRMGLSSRLSVPHSQRLAADYRAHISMEFDFLSLGAGVDLNYAMNQKNTQLQLALDVEYDRVHPVGNLPIGLASMAPENTLQPRGRASTDKRVQGVATGITQLLDRRSLMQLKYTYAQHDGYLTDPYKILSIIEDTDSANLGATLDYVYEKRPRERLVQSIYTAYKRNITDDVLTLSYRYLWDDWDIVSDTLDMKYRFGLADSHYMEPHVRLYRQSAADFYHHSLPASDALPAYASADFRLAEFDALTLGLEYGKKLGLDREYRLALEYYRQTGDSHPADAIGLQRQQDLFPVLHTLIIKYVYSYQW